MAGEAENLLRAKTELLEGVGEDRERLAAAARDVHAALADEADWPAGLRASADAVRAVLPCPRTLPAAVAAMSDDAARKAANLVWALCLEAEDRRIFTDPGPADA